jgi:hypothetical protein
MDMGGRALALPPFPHERGTVIFVSKFGAFKKVAIKEKYDPLTGRGLGGGFICEFQPDVLTAHMDILREEEKAGRLKFNGTPIDGQTREPKDPAERCSSFNTDSIADPALRRDVEQALLNAPDFGASYWHFEKPIVEAPWPAYDRLVAGGRGRTTEMVAEKIAETVVEIGADPAKVADYERSNLNRQAVIDAIEALISSQAPDPAEALVEA